MRCCKQRTSLCLLARGHMDLHTSHWSMAAEENAKADVNHCMLTTYADRQTDRQACRQVHQRTGRWAERKGHQGPVTIPFVGRELVPRGDPWKRALMPVLMDVTNELYYVPYG